FSSRRRHTRSTRDWSSDVCSSDLFDAGDQQPAVCRVDGSAGFRAADRRVAGPLNTPRPHPGDEWGELPVEEQQEEERPRPTITRSEEHTSELQSRVDLVCRLLLEK